MSNVPPEIVNGPFTSSTASCFTRKFPPLIEVAALRFISLSSCNSMSPAMMFNGASTSTSPKPNRSAATALNVTVPPNSRARLAKSLPPYR